MTTILREVFLGFSYGFAAGVSPGPTFSFIISQTLQKGFRAGMFVAIAPLLTDFPIIFITTFLIGQLPHNIINWIGVLGGVFVIYLGIETIRNIIKNRYLFSSMLTDYCEVEISEDSKNRFDDDSKKDNSSVLWRAIFMNLFNPHPYLFWGGVGSQYLINSYHNNGVIFATSFLISFYILLVGSKLSIALLVHQSRKFLNDSTYRNIIIFSGVLLIFLGILLIYEGISSVVFEK